MCVINFLTWNMFHVFFLWKQCIVFIDVKWIRISNPFFWLHRVKYLQVFRKFRSPCSTRYRVQRYSVSSEDYNLQMNRVKIANWLLAISRALKASTLSLTSALEYTKRIHLRESVAPVHCLQPRLSPRRKWKHLDFWFRSSEPRSDLYLQF